MSDAQLYIAPPGARFFAGFVNHETDVRSDVYQHADGTFFVLLRDSEHSAIYGISDPITAQYKARELAGLKPILVTESHAAYAHTRLSGICGPDVTVDDIRREMFHPYFGGREARVSGGKWSCVRHDD